MLKILLVEDEPLIRAGIKKLIELMPQHFVVEKEAGDGKEALDYLQNDIPDIVITDIRMKEVSGLTLIQKIREKNANIPIVIVSGHDDFHYAQQAIRYGVVDYLLKPIDRTMFIATLKKIRSKLIKDREPRHSNDETAENQPDQVSERNSRIVRKLKDYIAANADGDLRLQVLADFIDLHPTYISQLFKMETGCNLSDYITEVRIEKAKRLLAETNLKIYDVARLSGFQSPKHFMLVFKQQVGKSPGAFREEA